ncbi:hypothetical protein ACWCXE_11225 [Streptomyces sp. NPDC001780]
MSQPSKASQSAKTGQPSKTGQPVKTGQAAKTGRTQQKESGRPSPSRSAAPSSTSGTRSDDASNGATLKLRKTVRRARPVPDRGADRPAAPRSRSWSLRPKALPVRWVVPVAVLGGALAGGLYGTLRTPEYTATSYVLVVPTDRSDPTAALGFATAYGRVASQVAVLADAQIWAGVPAEELKSAVRTATSPDAPMISVTATSTKPSAAVAMADGVARALVSNGSHMQGSTNVRVVQLSRAVTPKSPASVSAPLAALVGGCAGGLIGGLGVLVLPKRRTDEDAAVTAAAPAPAPAPTAVPKDARTPQAPVTPDTRETPATATTAATAATPETQAPSASPALPASPAPASPASPAASVPAPATASHPQPEPVS